MKRTAILVFLTSTMFAIIIWGVSQQKTALLKSNVGTLFEYNNGNMALEFKGNDRYEIYAIIDTNTDGIADKKIIRTAGPQGVLSTKKSNLSDKERDNYSTVFEKYKEASD